MLRIGLSKKVYKQLDRFALSKNLLRGEGSDFTLKIYAIDILLVFFCVHSYGCIHRVQIFISWRLQIVRDEKQKAEENKYIHVECQWRTHSSLFHLPEL